MKTSRSLTATIILVFISLAGYSQMMLSARTIHKHCPQENVVLKVDQFRGEIQWQQTNDGGNWKNIPGARTGSFVIDPSIETAYRAAIAYGNCDTIYSDTLLVIVETKLVPSVSVSTEYLHYCTGDTATFHAVSDNGGNQPEYVWYVNDTVVVGRSGPVFTYEPSDKDVVRVKMTSDQECFSDQVAISEPVTIIVKDKLLAQVAIEVDQTEVCEGAEVTFRAISQNPGSNPRYRWFINDRLGNILSTAIFKYVPRLGDKFHVQLTSNHECVAEPIVISEIVVIKVEKIVEPKVDIHASTTEICGDAEVAYTATPAFGGDNPVYNWFVNGIAANDVHGAIFTYKPLDGDSIYVELISNLKCVTQRSVKSVSVKMGPCKTLATVATSSVSSITHNSAVSGGNVTADGNSFVTERGVCWSTHAEPTIDDFKTSNGTGLGPFTGTLTGLVQNTTYFVRAYAVNSKGTSYGEIKSFTTDRTMSYSVTQPVASNLKDTIKTPSAVLVIPQDALESSGNVTIAVDGKQVIEMQNEDIKVVGDIFNISLPGNKIINNIYLSFPMPPIDVLRENYLVFLYNGRTYYPVEFTIVNDTVRVVIDIIDWEQYEGNETKGLNLFSEIIAIGIVYEQIPPQEMLGIKKITIDNEKFVFTDPVPAITPKKLLLFIHGWIGDPTTWDVMIPKISSDQELGYDEIWTYGYNSSLSIEENSQKLRNDLARFSGNNKIDIVAHSMGGLVSRSMIEFYNGSQFVNRIITLGTPHHGSSLAAIREVIGFLMVHESGIWGRVGKAVFDIKTQGLKDLDNNSSFIKKLKSSEKPGNIPYYLIAAINNPHLWPPSNKAFLPGDDDGIVTVQSAFGSPYTLKSEPILMAEMLAHTKMNKEYQHYIEVLKYLKMPLPGNPPVANFSASPTSVSVGGSVQFTDQSANNPISWTWSFGDGTMSTQQNPVKTYTTAGTYTVSLTVTNSYGSNTSTKNNYIDVSDMGGNPTGTFTDSRDGKTYNWVKIGDQTWMSENLAYLPSVSPSSQDSYTAQHYYVYDYHGTDVAAAKQHANYKTYGALYNWPAALTACPQGWHLPSDQEWKQLEGYLGLPIDELDNMGFRGSEQGSQLKSPTGWTDDLSGSNSSGFTAIPAGYRFTDFEWMGAGLAWWSSTPASEENAIDRGLSNQTNKIDRYAYGKNSGFSVRCVRN
jgi:uncharacterized protein (TIGR02145 family)